MTEFGKKLRSQRESRELTLAEICESTKIRKVYLQALEDGDFAALPGGVFTKGYIRSYAQALGINADRLLEEYENERVAQGLGTAEEDDRAAQDAAKAALNKLAGAGEPAPGAIRRWTLYGAIGLAVILTGAGAAWWMLRGDGPQSTEPTVASRPESAAPERKAPEPEAAEPVPAEPVAVVPAAMEPVPARPVAVEPEIRKPPPVERSPVETGLRVSESGVGTGIVDRQLAGQANRFDEGTRVWFWNRVLDGKPGDSIVHVWIHDGEEVGATRLKIGGSHWRTQSSRTLRAGSTGSWVVETRDAQERVLARAGFVCDKP